MWTAAMVRRGCVDVRIWRMSAIEEARSGEHGDAEAALVARLKGSFQHSSGGGEQPGGWWIYIGVDGWSLW